jgi:hypothetical protein
MWARVWSMPHHDYPFTTIKTILLPSLLHTSPLGGSKHLPDHAIFFMSFKVLIDHRFIIASLTIFQSVFSDDRKARA